MRESTGDDSKANDASPSGCPGPPLAHERGPGALR